MTDTSGIVVLGAGVLGLTVAYQLSQRPGFRVEVFAKSLPIDPPIDYTSQYAGAVWRSACGNHEAEKIEYEGATLVYLREFSKSHPELVRLCTSYDIFNLSDSRTEEVRVIRRTEIDGVERPWFTKLCEEYRVMEKHELPSGAATGVAYDTLTVNAPEYVKWLYEACLKHGVHFTVRELNSFDELAASHRIVVNCTGLGSRSLAQDDNLYPTKGQTVLVKNTTNLTDTYLRFGPGLLSYLIPRPGNGGLIIGGSQVPESWDYNIDLLLADEMLRNAYTQFPGVFPPDHSFEVIKHSVGLRPSRKGGVRVESEQIGCRTIVHGYGIGGWGFMSSWGIGNKLCDLVDDALRLP